ncbi:MAG: hypothetical protein P9L91_10345 [Candidatus Zophobacter franzmannii]|nr:hypothetical protein [Candidatus Zophobacter franzmannii]
MKKSRRFGEGYSQGDRIGCNFYHNTLAPSSQIAPYGAGAFILWCKSTQLDLHHSERSEFGALIMRTGTITMTHT